MTKNNILTNQAPIYLVIFDCDGVLIDSETLSKRVLLTMLNDLGAKVSDDYYYTHFLGYNFQHVTEKVLTDFSVTLTEAFRQRYRQALTEVFSNELETTKDIKWLLAQLNVKSCVATSGSPEKVSHSLGYTALDSYFNNHVFTSSEVKTGKPAPDLFLHAAKKMGIEAKNCLVIEDSEAGIQGALAAKMQVIRFAGASHMKDRYTNPQQLDDVCTIVNWQELFDKAPSLKSSSTIER